MSYRQVMDDAIGDSPVSTVDVDTVIARQRRDQKVRRWGACGAAAAAVLALAVTVPQVLPGHTRPGPADDPQITTVAGTPADLTRLDNAVFTAVKREVPGLKWHNPASPDVPDWSHEGGDQDTLVSYRGQGAIVADGVRAHLMVTIVRHGSERTVPPCVDSCRESAGPRGERVRTGAMPPEGSKASDRRSGRYVRVLRPADDTVIMVTLESESPDGIRSMSLAQQTAIALDPAIALAPVPPAPSPSPTGTSPPADPAQQRRIDNAVFASLRQQAPDSHGESGPNRDRRDLSTVWLDSGGDNNTDSYWGQGRIGVNGVTGLFSVQIERESAAFGRDMTCGKPSRTSACTAGTSPHGERYRTVTNTRRNASEISADRSVYVLRKDGSWLSVYLNADPPDATFALTAAQQQAIAFDQAIALTSR
jgi:hypothetical protein